MRVTSKRIMKSHPVKDNFLTHRKTEGTSLRTRTMVAAFHEVTRMSMFR
jgi:hypothetical protein